MVKVKICSLIKTLLQHSSSKKKNENFFLHLKEKNKCKLPTNFHICSLFNAPISGIISKLFQCND